ncbi:hypothetical protein AMECASPLE_023303 [Ameca splendens]|uniref:Uncharacterized protein n=1 Tax=Ameca splendens TaxID=208324 RepID=A0ABV0ZRM4_9TELE
MVSERMQSSPNSLLCLAVEVRYEQIALYVWLYTCTFSFACNLRFALGLQSRAYLCAQATLNLKHQAKYHSKSKLKGTSLASKAIREADEGSRESQKF